MGISLLQMVREVLSKLAMFYLRSEGKKKCLSWERVFTTKGEINTKVLRQYCIWSRKANKVRVKSDGRMT